MKQKETGRVLSQERLSEDIFSLWLETPAAAEAVPGQFLSLYVDDPSRLLPRPISICEIEEGRLRLVYRTAGEGTRILSRLREGETVSFLGPLGNGFPLQGGTAVLVGGGIGIPPMLALAKALPGEKVIILGYRDKNMFLLDELSALGRVVIATYDGSAGVHGTVLDAMRQEGVTGDVLYACGPKPMLRALKAWSIETGVPAWISLEERMACGVGACLACVCHTMDVDEHSQVKNRRVCKDGPVFSAGEVEL